MAGSTTRGMGWDWGKNASGPNGLLDGGQVQTQPRPSLSSKPTAAPLPTPVLAAPAAASPHPARTERVQITIAEGIFHSLLCLAHPLFFLF